MYTIGTYLLLSTVCRCDVLFEKIIKIIKESITIWACSQIHNNN